MAHAQRGWGRSPGNFFNLEQLLRPNVRSGRIPVPGNANLPESIDSLVVFRRFAFALERWHVEQRPVAARARDAWQFAFGDGFAGRIVCGGEPFAKALAAGDVTDNAYLYSLGPHPLALLADVQRASSVIVWSYAGSLGKCTNDKH